MADKADGVQSMGDLMDIVAGYWSARAVLTGHEIGLFTALGTEALAAEELAQRVACPPRAVELLANALVALGLLTKSEGRFANGAFADAHLVRGKPAELCGYLDHHLMLYRRWADLTETVRAGGGKPFDGEMPPESLRAFIMAMHASSSHWGTKLLPHLDLTGVKRIIDIGGGSGDYAYAMLKVLTEATAVIFDRPDVLPIARECAELAGVSDRVDTLGGSYWENELGEGFDLAIVSNILHSTGPDGCVTILSKAFRCLAPGGRAVVHDFILSEDATSPPWAALFSLNMLSAGNDGRSYTAGEISEFLRQAGFERSEYTQVSEDTGIVVGWKGA
jgi:ubiquinone/menaquinone biosynthesis C-methylase UbiE